jgi:hypothetical protein
MVNFYEKRIVNLYENGVAHLDRGRVKEGLRIASSCERFAILLPTGRDN